LRIADGPAEVGACDGAGTSAGETAGTCASNPLFVCKLYRLDC